MPEDAPTIPITFINPHPAKSRLKQVDPAEDSITVDARIGETLLQTAIDSKLILKEHVKGYVHVVHVI